MATPAPGISIELSVPPGTTTAGNPEDLSRMFRNLLDNAVRYARRRVLITAAIVREIAAAYGATIVLTEAAGGGTRAVVTMGGTKGPDGETTARSVQRSGQNE